MSEEKRRTAEQFNNHLAYQKEEMKAYIRLKQEGRIREDGTFYPDSYLKWINHKPYQDDWGKE